MEQGQEQLAWGNSQRPEREEDTNNSHGPTSQGLVNARDPDFGLDPWLQKSWDSERTSLPSAASPPGVFCVPNAKQSFLKWNVEMGRVFYVHQNASLKSHVTSPKFQLLRFFLRGTVKCQHGPNMML